ncbi:nucleoside diphosphate kinase regulator [Klebsiella pneumoniae subsp. pneumoniae]|nr:nucleoside diphosphate kinase regulator [Klebsiella pneumoniae subsp. pneumoniae]
MTRPAIIINELDAERIDRLLEQPAFANSPVADALNEELDRAQMLAPEAMPHDVVTMNSRVKFRDLTSGEERVRTLVFPSQVTDSASQLSVLAPVGRAAGPESRQHHSLGAAGRRIDAPEVLELLYQPEAAGEFHR